MLLRHKKTQGEDQNWCVILSPIQSELDRKRVAQKISAVFSLSFEESADLVSNTPIILLDNLTRAVAAKLKEYFRAVGAETVLTNDVFQKRKCYRTVWPEPPSLSFLHEWNPLIASADKEDREELHPEQALDEIRTISKDDKKSQSLTSMPFMARTERDQLAEEAQRWRRETLKLQEEVQELKEQLERIQKEQFLGLKREEENNWTDDKDKEVQEIKALIEHTNEKYETLKQEYASARHLYEEKIATLVQDSDQPKKKLAELSENLRLTQKEKQSLEEKLIQRESQARQLEDDAARARMALEQKIIVLSSENEQVRNQNTDLSERLRVSLQEKRVYEEKAVSRERDFSQLEIKLREVQEKFSLLERSKRELELTADTQSEQIAYWHSRHDSLLPKFLEQEKFLSDEKKQREALEIRYQELEKVQSLLMRDLEDASQQAKGIEARFRETEYQFNELKNAYQEQEKFLQNNMRQLEIRERELEATRRQLRDVTQQIEQRETSQKRAQLAAQLTEKETMLKKLVKEQEKIVSEIKEREDFIRTILTQQESVEREIVEAKQTQRHLAELTKREQKSKFRLGGAHSEENAAESDSSGE